MKKIYPTEQKQEIIKRHLCGVTITELSRETGVSRSTLYSWLKEYNNSIKIERQIRVRDFYDLKKKCDQQEKMIEILQRSPCTVSAPLRERFKVVSNLSDEYSISLLCKTLNVAKGSYFNHILRNKNEDTLAAKKRAELTPVIEEIFNESKQIYGANKVHAVLKERGYCVGEKTVSNIMHDNGWFSVRGASKKLYLMYQEKKQNLLNQQFTVSRPNEVWVGDVTQFRFKGRNYYICVIIDLYSRKVVSYKISKSNSTQLTKATFKYAYESRQPTDLLFHSDRGGNYTSNAYTSYLEQLGIRQSFSRASTPYDNSVIEAFFKSLKAEKLYLIDIDSEKELFSAIKNYMNFYNSSRPHTVLGYTTPDAFEARFFRKLKGSKVM